MPDEILFFSGSLAFTEDGDLDWSLMLNQENLNEEEIDQA